MSARKTSLKSAKKTSVKQSEKKRSREPRPGARPSSRESQSQMQKALESASNERSERPTRLRASDERSERPTRSRVTKAEQPSGGRPALSAVTNRTPPAQDPSTADGAKRPVRKGSRERERVRKSLEAPSKPVTETEHEPRKRVATASSGARSSSVGDLSDRLLRHRTLLLQWCFVNARAKQAFDAQGREAVHALTDVCGQVQARSVALADAKIELEDAQ